MARPRPVTATVTKLDWMKAPATIHQTLSFDSTGSTASLVSILDHDSYMDSDGEMQETPVSSKSSKNSLQESQDSLFKAYTQSADCKEALEKVERSHPKTLLSGDTCCNVSIKSVSPWERWLVEKEKQNRDKLEKERAEKILNEVTQIDHEHMECQKKIRQREKIFRWIQKKTLAEKLRISKEREKQRVAMQENMRKKHEVNENAKQKFADWLQKKQNEEKVAKKVEAECKKEEEEKKKKKQILAEEKYHEWYKRVLKTQIKPSTGNLGYIYRKPTECHYRTAYPQPNFYNPVPWKQPSIPNLKMEKRKTK